MRTLLKQIVHSTRASLNLKSNRQYSVCGVISFVIPYIPPGKIEFLEALRRIILEIDSQFPWKDVNDSTNEQAKSIGCLSDGDYAVNNWHTPEMICWFKIHPGIRKLTKGQFHAYEKYLGKIAEELATRRLFGVETVRCCVRIQRSQEFPVKN